MKYLVQVGAYSQLHVAQKTKANCTQNMNMHCILVSYTLSNYPKWVHKDGDQRLHITCYSPSSCGIILLNLCIVLPNNSICLFQLNKEKYQKNVLIIIHKLKKK